VQVGDLVRVYHFSHTARRHYKARADTDTAHLFYMPDDIDGHTTGLIVADTSDGGDWQVLIPKYQSREIYATERLEVINESR
jgi:hypothetical protein